MEGLLWKICGGVDKDLTLSGTCPMCVQWDQEPTLVNVKKGLLEFHPKPILHHHEKA